MRIPLLRKDDAKPFEAKLYRKLQGGDVECSACARHCRIPKGATGFCGIRQNTGGKLYLLAYGKPFAIASDPVEKKPLFHFMPGSRIYSMGTFGCTFACDFCQNWDTSQLPRLIGGKDAEIRKRMRLLKTAFDEIQYVSPESFAMRARMNGCRSVAFTYNEPTIFAEYAHDCAREARALGLKTVYVSDGYESKESMEYIAPVLDAINIDIKAFTETFYRKLCHASLEPVLESVKRARKHGIWTEITTLVIPGENDSKEELAQIAKFIGDIDRDMPWHVTAFHPDYKMGRHKATPPAKLIEAQRIGKDEGLNFVYAGNLPGEYSYLEHTYCPKCKELLVEREGSFIVQNRVAHNRCPECKGRVAGIWS